MPGNQPPPIMRLPWPKPDGQAKAAPRLPFRWHRTIAEVDADEERARRGARPDSFDPVHNHWGLERQYLKPKP